MTGPLSVAIVATFTNVAAGYPVGLTALTGGRTMATVWHLGAGVTITNQPYVTHAWAAPGAHKVVLHAYNDSHPAGVSATAVVHVVTAPVHYVAADSMNPLAPFTNWATAAVNIQDAVDAAGTLPGTLILVTNGVYATGGRAVYGTMTNRVAVGKPLTLRSVNGSENTIIRGFQIPGAYLGCGEGAIRCVYLTNGASLSGFTLTNGATLSDSEPGGYRVWEQSGGAVLCESVSAVVSNCVLSGNSARLEGGGVYGGAVYERRLIGNKSIHGGGASFCLLKNCVLNGNWGSAGGGASYCTLENCTLTGNATSVTSGSGGGSYDSTLYNCTVAGNYAWRGGGDSGSTLNHCVLNGNSARSGGGTYDSTLNNCILTGNSSTGLGQFEGGGGAFGGILNNCTVAGNSAAGKGGGLISSRVINCIIYFNSAPSGSNHMYGAFNYSCTSPANGIGNIDLDPLFVDTNGWSNLRLQSNSPCINAGNNAGVIGITDLDGNPRILGGTVDMSAYEFVPPPPPTPTELVERLIALVNESDLRHRRPLLATLEAALASIERGNSIAAANQLHAFQNKVRAQVTRQDEALANQLIEAAAQIIAALGRSEAGRVAIKLHELKRHPNGKTRLKFGAPPGRAYIVEASPDLVEWSPLGPAMAFRDGEFEFEDAQADRHACRFYRVLESK